MMAQSSNVRSCMYIQRSLLSAALSLPLLVHAAAFTGSWSTTDFVCKRACTKEDPEPDFEIRIGIILVQRGAVVCGVRNQNDLSDRSTTIPLRGVVKDGTLALDAGEPSGDGAPHFPFKVEGRTRFRLKGKTLVEASESGIDFAKYKARAFPTADMQRYVDANSGYFNACFASAL